MYTARQIKFTEDKLTACSYKKQLNQEVHLIISFESPNYSTANRTILIINTYGIPNWVQSLS